MGTRLFQRWGKTDAGTDASEVIDLRDQDHEWWADPNAVLVTQVVRERTQDTDDGGQTGAWSVESLYERSRQLADAEQRRREADPEGVDWESSDPWEIFSLPRTAPWNVVTSRFRELVRQWHPDHATPEDDEARAVAEDRMCRITAAYDRLKQHYRPA